MSTTDPTTDSSADTPNSPHSRLDGQRLVAGLQKAGAVCPWCFAPVRDYHPDFEAMLAKYLRDNNNGALRARGHELNQDGTITLGTIRASTDNPQAEKASVPATVVETTDDDGNTVTERRPAQKKTVCSCGVIDIDNSQRRDKWTLYEAVGNLTDAFKQRGFDVDTEAMRDHLERELDNCRPGRDRELLGRVVEAGVTRSESED